METLKQKLMRMLADMKAERDSYISHWKLISENTRPRAQRFLQANGGRGLRMHQKLYNNTPMLASRILASGMMSGVTSPARPWFKLSTGDPNLDEQPDVKNWLHTVTERMREVFGQSNLYTILPAGYADLGDFGTAAITVERDADTIIRFAHLPIGEWYFGVDDKGRVNRMAREFQMSVFAVVKKFKLENCSAAIKTLHERGQFSTLIDVVHVVYPNEDYQEGAIRFKQGKQVKAFCSVHFEKGGPADQVLGEGFFERFPVFGPRWNLNGTNVYGDSCGMEALNDCLSLQVKEKRKLQMINTGANPALAAPTTLRNQGVSLLPGDLTYVDTLSGQTGIAPIYQPNPTWLTALEKDIEKDEDRIKRAYYVDLFLMLSQMEGVQPRNQMEIAERKEEKLLQLGPVMDRLNDELFDPLIETTFDFMVQGSIPDWEAGLPGLIPQPPEELQDRPLRVEYTSIMAQAMKAVGLGGIERFVGFMGNIAAADPQVMDALDTDETAREYHKNMGLAPKILRDAEEVQAIRQQRQQAMAAQQAAETAKTAGQAVQSLASAQLTPDNALSRVLGNLNPSGEALPI